MKDFSFLWSVFDRGCFEQENEYQGENYCWVMWWETRARSQGKNYAAVRSFFPHLLSSKPTVYKLMILACFVNIILSTSLLHLLVHLYIATTQCTVTTRSSSDVISIFSKQNGGVPERWMPHFDTSGKWFCCYSQQALVLLYASG